MGKRGPLPKRSDEAHTRGAGMGAPGKDGFIHTVSPAGNNVTIPEPDPDWHHIARYLWDGMLESGAARFYESSDWAVLFSLCDDITYYKRCERRSGQMLSSINSMMTSLLCTEGDRRRVGIELQKDKEEKVESEGIASMRDFLARKLEEQGGK